MRRLSLFVIICLILGVAPAKAIDLVFVRGGCFNMGDAFGDGDADERPVHRVCVDDFYLGRYEVTQGEWKGVMGDNPSTFRNGDAYPVDNVSWNDLQVFIGRLNSQTGKRYRLPTEAEWEYAARSGGRKERFGGFSDIGRLSRYANFCDNRCEYAWKTLNQDDGYAYTAPVGSYTANGLGLHDMTGNVWEWCQDWYGESYYGESPQQNPRGPEEGTFRIMRGGSWRNMPSGVRTTVRGRFNPDDRNGSYGFRLLLPAP